MFSLVSKFSKSDLLTSISLIYPKKPKLEWKVRQEFYQHLIDQVGNEIALDTALNHFKARMVRTKQKLHARTIALIGQKLKNGYTFSQTLEGLVSKEEIAIISAGELGGKLPFALMLILEQHSRTSRLMKTLRQGLASTIGHLSIATAVLWYLASAVIPQLTQAVPPSKARGLVSVLYTVSNAVHSIGILLVPLVLGISIGLFVWSLPRWTGRSRLIAERYFPFNYYRDLVGYQWLMMFATLLSSGIADVQILEIQAKNASPYLRERITLFFHRLRSGGMSLGDALITPIKHGRGLGMNFPNPDINESIVALYGFANFPERISKLISAWANQIEERTLSLVKSISGGLEILMMLILTLLILAIQDLGSQIGGANF